MRGLKGNPAIVTGGASGIGQAICLRLGEEGCAVGVFDLDGPGAEAVAQAVTAAGGRAYPHTVDITDYEAVARAVAAFEGEAGPAGILVNNAGWDRIVTFLESDRAFWDKVLAVNLHGPLNVHHVVLRGMAERGRGKVVNIASDAGRVGSMGEAVYSACKGGLIALSKTLAREMAARGVTVNVICPGLTDTPLLAAIAGESPLGAKIIDRVSKAIPLRRLGRPEDIPGAVAFLASDDADYITGQVLSISGGLTMHG